MPEVQRAEVCMWSTSRCTSAAVLSAGELLCRSCAVDTFSGAEQRDAALRHALAHGPPGPALVFANTLASAKQA